jgi:hypothetical protein
MEAHWKVFGVRSREELTNKEIVSGTPSSKYFTRGCARGFLWRMRETKITDMDVNWLYSALISRQSIDPTHLMINRWCCEATSGSGNIGSGCYLSMLAISLRPGISRNPEHLLGGTSLGFEY